MAAIASLTTREYSSGSCTLRITGQLSPLSQWADKRVMLRSRFHLQLLPENELDPLGELSSDPAPQPRLELSGRAEQFLTLTNAVNRYVQTHLTMARGTEPPPFPNAPVGGITLGPLGLTRYRLTLPADYRFNRFNQLREVELSALELADLADVLEQADGDLYLPSAAELPSRRSSRPALPIWIGSAAAVGIAAILGSQWLPSPTPVPTATREGNVAVEEHQELETLSQEPAPAVENTPNPATGASPDQPMADTAEESQPAAPPAPTNPEATAPQTTLKPTSPNDQTPPPPAPSPVPPPTASADRPAADRTAAPQTTPAPAPEARTGPSIGASEAPRTPETDQTPAAATPAPASEPAYPAPSAARESGGEAFSQPAPSQEGLTRPDTTNSQLEAGTAPERSLADSMAASGNPLPPWQEQLRQRLQQNWTPSPDQSGPLRYRLSIDREGNLRSIMPLSAEAQRHQESINWPQVGTSIPTYPQGAPAILELQFLDTGEVILRPVSSPPGLDSQE